MHLTGAGQDEAGEVYLTAWESASEAVERDYNPFDNSTGTVWWVVSANRVPDGAETAPLEQPDEPSATSAREGEEALSTEADLVISRSKRVKHDMLAALPTGNVEITLCHPYSAIGSARSDHLSLDPGAENGRAYHWSGDDNQRHDFHLVSVMRCISVSGPRVPVMG